MERRLRKLEQTNRVLICALLAVCAVILSGQAQESGEEQLIRCARLEVIDESGDVIAAVGKHEDGSAGLFLYDGNAQPRLAAIHDSGQTALYLLDASGSIRAGAAHYVHGGSGFALHGDSARGAAVLYYKDGGSLTFYDKQGAALAKYPAK